MMDTETIDDINIDEPEYEGEMGERAMWATIGVVFLCVLVVLLIVYNREKEKPNSPQAYVAAKFSQLFNVQAWQHGNIQEWQPGMGQQPLLYHPAAVSGSPVWMPLPDRSVVYPQNSGIVGAGNTLQSCPAGTGSTQSCPGVGCPTLQP